MYITESFEF